MSNVAEVLKRRDPAAMRALAEDWKTAPEVLFVLSQIPETDVRLRVAANPATPDLADRLLLDDGAAEIRAAVGRKIVEKLPHLDGAASARLRDGATAKLLLLARDREVAVRRILADAVRTSDLAPKKLVLTLVRDIDELVAVPIAEFSPLLDDDDLVALIAERPMPATLAAIARRDGLGTGVAESLIAVDDADVTAALLRNRTVHLREETLDDLIERARDTTVWHEPLTLRAELTEALVDKLSRFVAANLVEQLAARNGLSKETRDKLARLAERSLEPILPGVGPAQPSEKHIRKAIVRRSQAAVVTALAMRAGVNARTVRRIFSPRSPKAICALARRACLSAALAEELQAFPGLVPEPERIPPGPGGDFLMDEEEMRWHLAAFGIETDPAPAAVSA